MNGPLKLAISHTLDRKWMIDYIEVGCADGESLIYVLSNAPSVYRATVFDNWGSEYGGTGRGSNSYVSQIVKKKFPDQIVDFEDGDSRETLPKFCLNAELVLVDGDHSPEGGEFDLKEAVRMCCPGGWIVFDDTFHPSHLYLRGIFETIARGYASEWYHILNDEGGCSLMRKKA